MKKFKEDKVYTIKYHTNEEKGKIECRTLEEFVGLWALHRNKENLIIDDVTSVTTITFNKTLADRVEEMAEKVSDFSYKLREKFERA